MTAVRFRSAPGLLLIAVFSAGAAFSADGGGDALRVHQARSRHGMVVSASEPASCAGRDVLADGGNAVDAAVATALALAVTWPEAGNLGGGGFMLVHPADARPPVCVDYREVAPRSATEDMFSWEESRYTLKMAGVPGTIRGLALAHERFGSLPWKRLVAPAIKLAEDGFVVDSHLAGSLNGVLTDELVLKHEPFAELRRLYGHPDGREWQTGDRLRLPDLAGTLRQIAESGPDAFYDGPLAERLTAGMAQGGGWISREDLRDYQAKLRTPIQGTFRGYDIYGPPPPSSGGIVLVQTLNILESFDIRSHDRYSVRTLHWMAEAMRRAFRDRAAWLGDPAFTDIPSRLTDKTMPGNWPPGSARTGRRPASRWLAKSCWPPSPRAPRTSRSWMPRAWRSRIPTRSKPVGARGWSSPAPGSC